MAVFTLKMIAEAEKQKNQVSTHNNIWIKKGNHHLPFDCTIYLQCDFNWKIQIYNMKFYQLDFFWSNLNKILLSFYFRTILRMFINRYNNLFKCIRFALSSHNRSRKGVFKTSCFTFWNITRDVRNYLTSHNINFLLRCCNINFHINFSVHFRKCSKQSFEKKCNYEGSFAALNLAIFVLYCFNRTKYCVKITSFRQFLIFFM